jgi:hypothetical protein
MAIVVIEGGHPNGTDLVSNESRFNPNAIAKAKGQTPMGPMPVLPLGDGNGIGAQLQIVPQMDEAGENVCFFLMTMGGRMSEIAGFQARPLFLAEIGRMPVADLKAQIAEAFAPKPEVVSV